MVVALFSLCRLFVFQTRLVLGNSDVILHVQIHPKYFSAREYVRGEVWARRSTGTRSRIEEQVKTLFAMRRANGDWFSIDDGGAFRVPLFQSSGDALLARSRETGMECFRPVLLDAPAFENLTTTDEGKACFWLVADPLRKLSRGRAFDRQQLVKFIANGGGVQAKSGVAQ